MCVCVYQPVQVHVHVHVYAHAHVHAQQVSAYGTMGMRMHSWVCVLAVRDVTPQEVLQSRPEAWRHYAAEASREFRDSLSGAYDFGGSFSGAASCSPPGSDHPPTPSPAPSPEVAQPNVGSNVGSSSRPSNVGSSSRSARVTPSAGQPATPGPRVKTKGSRLRAELRG